jgi:hypothetical protein
LMALTPMMEKTQEMNFVGIWRHLLARVLCMSRAWTKKPLVDSAHDAAMVHVRAVLCRAFGDRRAVEPPQADQRAR